MLFSFTLLFFGVIFLFLGAEWLIKGGVNFALFMGVRPIVVGLTIVAVGTSLPEGVSSLIAQINYPESNIALANLVGSNIANIGLILGLSALIKPINLSETLFDYSMVIFSTAFVFALLASGEITRGLGGLLLLFSLFYALYKFKKGDHLEEEASEYKERGLPLKKDILLIVLGSALISAGGYALIEGAYQLALLFGISERVVGLSVVAIGTSLPELATSLVAIYRAKEDILLGNILGSNISNFLLILGCVSLAAPIKNADSIYYFDCPVAAAFVFFLGIAYRKGVVGRVWGGFVLAFYFAYMVLIFNQ